MLLGIINLSLCCVKILEGKTLNAFNDRRASALTLFGFIVTFRAIEESS